MKIVRWAAAAVTALMSLMNIPIPFQDDGIPAGLAWAITALGILGITAAIGLIRGARWGRPGVLAVGAVNLGAAVVALFTDTEGAVIGLGVSALILVLGFLAPRSGPTAVGARRYDRPSSRPSNHPSSL